MPGADALTFGFPFFEQKVMPRIKTTVTCAVRPSFRVSQVCGMFDVPPADRSSERFDVEVPGLEQGSRHAVLLRRK